MKALSLFSGIGGIDLACEWAGIETVAFCEREPFPQKVLRKHWPNVPIYDDVCTLTKERLEANGIDTGTIGVISAGYPCPPFSIAGKREGKEDDRYLWPEVFRLIQDIKPRWFIGENVTGHVTLGLDEVLANLESIDYAWESFVIPAAAVGFDTVRTRVFMVAFPKSIGREWKWSRWQKEISAEFERRCEGLRWTGADEPRPIGVANGVSERMERLKALGNAVNPYQIYPILAAIKQIDDMMRTG